MDTERFGAIEGLECVAEQVHDGFAYTPLAYDAYDRYRADKEKFPGFDAFLLELAGLYGSILSPESWIRKSPWAGALSIDDVRASTTLNSTLVVPTVYEDEDLERRINAHIRALAPSMTSGRVSWDTDALPVPPENGAWVLFGGPANNVVLSRWAESFPFQVTPDAIEVDGRRFEGTDLRLIAALPNPSGLGPTGVPKGGAGWIVYTAQRDADILGVETVPNGRTAWVLARGQEVLAEGFFLPESVRRALPPPPTPPEARP
jgi:hypothetical protein